MENLKKSIMYFTKGVTYPFLSMKMFLSFFVSCFILSYIDNIQADYSFSNLRFILYILLFHFTFMTVYMYENKIKNIIDFYFDIRKKRKLYYSIFKTNIVFSLIIIVLLLFLNPNYESYESNGYTLVKLIILSTVSLFISFIMSFIKSDKNDLINYLKTIKNNLEIFGYNLLFISLLLLITNTFVFMFFSMVIFYVIYEGEKN